MAAMPLRWFGRKVVQVGPAFGATGQSGELLAEGQVLEHEVASGEHGREDGRQEGYGEAQHRAGESPRPWPNRQWCQLGRCFGEGQPLVRVLTASSNLVLKPFGDATSFTEARHSTAELQQLVEEAGQAGSLDANSSEIAARALDFGGLTATAVMVPRNRIVAVPHNANQGDLRKIVLGARFSRMPVFEETLDNIVGDITKRDVLALAWEREEVVLADILRPAFFVPETTGAGRILQEMKRRKVPLAVVVDEHGGVCGLITMEDLVEELVGDLASEDERSDSAVRIEPDGSALVKGPTAIRDVNRELGLELPEGDGWTTIAGLCIALAGGIPQPGTHLLSGDQTLEVVEASARAVALVRVKHPRPVAPPQTGSHRSKG